MRKKADKKTGRTINKNKSKNNSVNVVFPHWACGGKVEGGLKKSILKGEGHNRPLGRKKTTPKKKKTNNKKWGFNGKRAERVSLGI